MAANHDLSYVSANDLLNKMSLKEILELTTESINAIEGDEEDVQDGLDYLDGLNELALDDLSDEAKHIAFVSQEALRWAESFVNSYAGRNYDLPMLASDGKVPYEVADAALSIGKYKLFNRRTTVPENVLADYQQALSWLERLADGKVVVNLIAAGSTQAATARSKTGLSTRTLVGFSSTI